MPRLHPTTPKGIKKCAEAHLPMTPAHFFIKPIDIQRVYTSVIPKIYNESSTYLMR